MSKLARKITPDVKTTPRRNPNAPGPRNQCWPLYGKGDLEDWQAVDSLRESINPETGKRHDWRSVQREVDRLSGVKAPLDLERFRYHWRRRCDCWPPELKL